MAFIFKFPDVGEGIHEGRVVEWLVAVGDQVAEDQAVVKVETDKAIVELPSPYAGVVLSLEAGADQTIHVGDPLLVIGELGEQAATPASTAEPIPDEPEQVAEDAPGVPAAPIRRPLATPRTRALARRLGIDLTTVKGTGNGGRITDEDVERAAREPAPVPAAPLEPATLPQAAGAARQASAKPVPAGRSEETAAGVIERVPISHLRKIIASSMRASKDTAAHVTHVDEADVTELVTHHRQVKAEVERSSGVKLTLLPFFIKALVTTLKEFPVFNAAVDEERQELLLKRFYNIGIAVDTPEGLIVPVLKDADHKDMVTIAAEVADLAERARSRTLRLEELRGGTCTITNIGPLGGVFATPIINQPELAIVGLHTIKERPAVVDGSIVVRSLMYLSVSFDHRYIDGAAAARFASHMVGLVSNPTLLMVRL